MSVTRTKHVIMDEDFFSLRARILEIAAGLDRLDRATGAAPDDPRRIRLEQALALLLDGKADRAERVQLAFSRQYDSSWRKKLAP
jgi:hypothetical protein